MLRGIFDIAFDYHMTRQMGATSISVKWLDDILWAINELDADAAVYCGPNAYKRASGAHSFIRRELMIRAQIPTLCMDGDAFDKRTAPMSVFQGEMERFIKHTVSRLRSSRRKISR
ncbi:MAG: 2-hydroxyacyl-CoA dehydratase family protein [Actinomycetota bacterium]|nr:2-hydroxyacyl-CoA dehydratase family protein [Actinomycetota bacterium]